MKIAIKGLIRPVSGGHSFKVDLEVDVPPIADTIDLDTIVARAAMLILSVTEETGSIERIAARIALGMDPR